MGDDLDEGAGKVAAVETYAAQQFSGTGFHDTVSVIEGIHAGDVDVIREQPGEAGVVDLGGLFVQPLRQQTVAARTEQLDSHISLVSQRWPIGGVHSAEPSLVRDSALRVARHPRRWPPLDYAYPFIRPGAR
ncbi:hypothetical protein [Williamsia sp. CHRR-6]|uniref:hypothetical protein n=1 Tax=Williamsia sp. CHRR-6 TaxID=2835871 RepID=UPI001BDA7028|nr:hypothetical protein [Williamsia sp. CHRR-6]MBT0566060.1 hypothetical protein [Williamsia sp. CHRR-6]